MPASIEFLPVEQLFLLHGPAFTYALRVLPDGSGLRHVYWGPRLRSGAGLAALQPDSDRAFAGNPPGAPRGFSPDTLPQEFPVAGRADRRMPALVVTRPADGSRVLELGYAGHEIFSGKPRLEGLPATYVEADAEADTLRVDLVDGPTGLRVELFYTVFRDHDALARSVRVVNGGGETLELERVLSASVDLPESVGEGGYEMLQLSGAWARERHVHRTPLRPGLQAIGSRRGASSAAQNPFLALLAPDATETRGRVFGMSLVYSGDFLAAVEVEPYGTARAAIGIHPETFGWRLGPGETFQSPEAVLAFSDDAGLGGLSRTYHRLYRQRLCRGAWRDRPRPVLLNNWEATYFDFDADKIERLAGAAADLGIELFVLDDGWFGHRDDDKTSLGDWTPDRRKLPAGIDDLARRVNARGIQFGLWFEPEMVSPDSDLFRAHPDWHLHVPGRPASTGRNQFILDLTRPEVCAHVYESVAAVLRSAPIAYVKWDMNRNFAETGSAVLPPERQREVPHRYLLGLYDVLERLTAEFPETLFESCSGGGGRFDPGMLHYMPQVWTSDDTDAVERLAIQHGTSVVYPLSTMGAHVSASPNHQVGRVTPIETRGHVALFGGGFGYELDLHALTDTERSAIREQVARVKELRALVAGGEFYRLLSPFENGGNETAWMVVSPDRAEALVLYVRVLAKPNGSFPRLPLRGLDPARDYAVERLDDGATGEGDHAAGGGTFPGDLLQAAGLPLPLGGVGGTADGKPGDFRSYLWRLRAG